MKLIYEDTQKEAKIGDIIKYNERFYFLINIIPPTGRTNSVGRVMLKPLEIYRKPYRQEFTPDEIGAIFIEEK